MERSTQRFLGIEALRLLCAVGVVIWHYQHFYFGMGGNDELSFIRERQPLWWLFGIFYEYGYVSIWFFWMISGFVFFWKYHEAIASGTMHGWRFFVLRFSRLYPLHVVTLVATAILETIYAAGHDGRVLAFDNNDAYHFILNLGFASSWGFERGYSFNGPVWSVSAEVLVYALFFAVSTVGARSLRGRLALVAGSVLLWAIVARLPMLYGHRVVLACAVFFFSGGVVQSAVTLLSRATVRRLAPVAVIAALAFACLTFDGRFGFLVFTDYRGVALVPKWAVFIVATLLVFGVVGLEDRKGFGRAFRTVAPLADTTYSSYLIHFPLQVAMVIMVDRLGFERTLFDSPVALGVYLIAVFGLAWLVFHHFERPVQNALRRWLLAANSRRTV